MDETLDYARLQLALNAGHSSKLGPGKVNGLPSADALREKIYIVRFDQVNGVLLQSDHQRNRGDGHCTGKGCHMSDFLYANNLHAVRIDGYDHDVKCQ